MLLDVFKASCLVPLHTGYASKPLFMVMHAGPEFKIDGFRRNGRSLQASFESKGLPLLSALALANARDLLPLIRHVRVRACVCVCVCLRGVCVCFCVCCVCV